jgi:hypothetical protein
MAVLPGYGVVHQDSLDLDPLMIDGSGPYKFDDAGVVDATQTWTEDIVSSPWVEGDTVTNRIRGMVTQQWRVQVRDVDQASVAADIEALYAAVGQEAFQVDMALGNMTWSWACRAAKTYGMSFDRRMVFSKIVTVPVTFDRYPTPLAGPY